MQSLALRRWAILACCVTIAACSHPAGLSDSPYTSAVKVAPDRTKQSNYDLLFSFDESQGSSPEGDLANLSVTLYGSTSYGGAYGGGTVFSITKDGTHKVLHSFGHVFECSCSGGAPSGTMAPL
jgi:uncharacterized repeat protein (TIGR03803 family)